MRAADVTAGIAAEHASHLADARLVCHDGDVSRRDTA